MPNTMLSPVVAGKFMNDIRMFMNNKVHDEFMNFAQSLVNASS